MRRTKIVCTIGPASESVDVLKKMITAGMDVARLNFSHGTHEEHGRRIENIRRAAKELNREIAIMLDNKGPEIRIGTFAAGKVTLLEGERFVLSTQPVCGDEKQVSVSYQGLPRDVKAGDMILIADGLVGLKVEETTQTEVICRVVFGGELTDHKNVNVPGVAINLPAVTEKDVADILFGITKRVDFIAASFIRKADDVLAIRRLLEQNGADIQIIAKIENEQGVRNIDEIIRVADGIMVARGDLGVQMGAEEIPLIQKQIIAKCNRVGKPVITATQMLESMTKNPRPTRAEASDVANAIFDGTDAIMLSGESAAGKYPVEAVATMARIAARTEEALHYNEILDRKGRHPQRTVTDAISHSTCDLARDLGARAIITVTKSGHTARMVSKYRPIAPVVAVTPSPDVIRRLALSWGVFPLRCRDTSTTDEMIQEAIHTSLQHGYIKSGDLVVITAGIPVGVTGTTNMIKVHIIGDVLVKGTGIGSRAATGAVRIARTAKDALTKVQPGDILVAPATDADYVPAMEKAAAIVAEEGGLTSHAAVVALSLHIPVIVGAAGAVSLLPDGETVTVDPQRGVVFRGEAHAL